MLKNEELDEAEQALAAVERHWSFYQRARFAKRTVEKENYYRVAGDWVNTWGRRLISDINERIDAEGERALDAWGDTFDREGKED